MTSVCEGRRNLLLRRVDWRFLLPDPLPRRTLCLTHGSLREGLKLVSTLSDEGDCDLAVAGNPTRQELWAMHSALTERGACYVECDRWSPTRLRRELQEVGFKDVRVYWAWPFPGRAPVHVWLPVDTPGPGRYYLEAARPPGWRGLLRRPLEWTWLAARRYGLLRPVSAIALKSGGLSGDQLLVTRGQRSINKPVTLQLGREGSPRLVIKHARVPESVPGLLREARALGLIEARHASLSGVPGIRSVREQEGWAEVAETPVLGQPLYMSLNRANYRRRALEMTRWLVELAGGEQPACPRRPLVEPVLARFESTFHPSAAELAAVRGALDGLRDLPEVIEHRDLSPWNVLVGADGDLRILDWESAETQGLPGLDLVYFLAHTAFSIDRAVRVSELRASYRALLDPSTFTGSVFEECWSLYAQELGLDPASSHALRLLTWMLHSQSEYERLAADSGRTPRGDELASSMFFNLFKEELAWQART